MPKIHSNFISLMFKDILSCSIIRIFVFITALRLDFMLSPTYFLSNLIFTNQNGNYIFCWILLQLFEPLGYVLKSWSACQVKYNESSRRAFVICVSDSSKPLLTSCVPNLYFYFVIFESYCFCSKLNTNRRFGFDAELIFLESRQQICLSNTGV